MSDMDDDDFDPPLGSLWTVVGWLTAAGAAGLVGVYLLYRMARRS